MGKVLVYFLVVYRRQMCSFKIFDADFWRLLKAVWRCLQMISLTSVLDGCPVEIRSPRCLFHLHYYASQPSTPPSALHPTPLRHFCSLISFTSALSAGFLWNPTANDGGLSRTTRLRSHYLSSALFLFLPHPRFRTIHLPLSSLSSALTSQFCVWGSEEEGCFSSQACNLSIIALFSPVIPDSGWSLWRLRPKNTSTCTEEPPLSYHWSVHRHSWPLQMWYVILVMWLQRDCIQSGGSFTRRK